MKKLLTALVITLGTAALAEQPVHPTQAQQEQQRNEGRTVKTGLDASEVSPTIKEAAKDTGQAFKKAAKDTKAGAGEAAAELRDRTGLDTAQQGTFDKSKSFSVKGILKNPGGGGVTIVREGLPNADLDVRKETLVMLDGKRVDSSDIPEGAQVRARFQLEGEEAVAVELNATSPKKAATPMK